MSSLANFPYTVPVKKLPHYGDLPLPHYATGGAAGCDFYAAIADTLLLPVGARALIPTGLSVAVPPGYEMQLRPRSGLANKHGIIMPNAPATIDSDYRGEIFVGVMNLGNERYVFQRGERIAQGFLFPVERIGWRTVDELPATERGSGAFGSTGRM